KYYIIAGEASGDLHASNLMKELKKVDSHAQFRFWGGDKMQAQGGELVVHYRHTNFMGFFEVVANIFTIIGLLKTCQRDLLIYAPDVLILIDYPGFNLRMAHFASKHRIRVFYYISPQIWAWKQSRVYQIKKWVTRMFVILPFEKDFYARFGVDVEFAGHPMHDALADLARVDQNTIREQMYLDERPVIALLPGSRKQEVKKMLGLMISITTEYPQYQFVVAGTSALPEILYDKIIGKMPVKLIFGQTYSLLQIAEAALVTSGTATLETALFKVPQVVCYKANLISYQIARRLVKVNYISLVNLIMNKPVVKELLQNDFNRPALIVELNKIVYDKKIRHAMLDHYQELEKMLGGPGTSARVAAMMHETLLKSGK
ncbi:MAG: lipid-A-disaccharide synthase, partial [Bacteroidales bacterium]|nr:lipid-A-disaccharide synthase [Bacteroidales bacterium]